MQAYQTHPDPIVSVVQAVQIHMAFHNKFLRGFGPGEEPDVVLTYLDQGGGSTRIVEVLCEMVFHSGSRDYIEREDLLQ